jgi:hypothetical protein
MNSNKSETYVFVMSKSSDPVEDESEKADGGMGLDSLRQPMKHGFDLDFELKQTKALGNISFPDQSPVYKTCILSELRLNKTV